MTTMTQQEKVIHIWEENPRICFLAGIPVGFMLFSTVSMFITELGQLLFGLVPEFIGIGFTVFFIDWIYQKRDSQNLQKRLIREAGSSSHSTATTAINWLNDEGWLTGKKGVLQNKQLWRANLHDTNLSDANLENSQLWEANLQEAHLERANLNGAELWKANLQKAELWKANLQDANLSNANLYVASLSDANLQRAKLVQTNLQDANLSNANLQHAFLWKTDLEMANLSLASLQHANLSRANFTGAVLFCANLKNADLRGTMLAGADLKGANLKGADLKLAFLEGATLPNGAIYTPATDMSQFTDSIHPNFHSTLDRINELRTDMGLDSIKEKSS